MNQAQKTEYRELCKSEDLSVFMQDWWLDAVCGPDQWGACISKDKEGKVQAALNYSVVKKLGFKCIVRAKMTPHAGIWLRYPQGMAQQHKRYSFEHQTIAKLIEQYPKASYHVQDFHYSQSNLQAFNWAGYKLGTRYTYVIEDCSDTDALFAKFKSEVRNRIRKAEQTIDVIYSDDLDTFFQLNKSTFERQNMKIPYDFELIQKLDKELDQRQMRKMYFAVDENKAVHAAIYVIFDKSTAYYVMGGSDPELRNSRAMYLLFWEAIQDAGCLELKFDFEGTMLQHIEPIFRSFGTEQKPYYRVEKKTRLFSILSAFLGKF